MESKKIYQIKKKRIIKKIKLLKNITKCSKNLLKKNLVRTDNSNDRLLMIKIHSNMKNWHKCNCFDEKCPSQRELRRYIQCWKLKDFGIIMI